MDLSRNVLTAGGIVDAGPAETRVRVRDVVRDVVADVAPEELPVVDGLAVFDDDTVVRRLRGRARRRERLGFGWDEIITMATPVVWLTVQQAAKQVGDAAGKGASSGAKTLLRKVFRRRRDEATLPPLTPAQIADIREQVRQVARKRGVKRADDLADALYTRLMLNAQSTTDDGTNPKP
jgi:hypothetical protein